MLDAANIFIQDSSSKVNVEIKEFIFKIHKWHKLKTAMNHIELTQLILEDSNYLQFLEDEENNSKNYFSTKNTMVAFWTNLP